jgi:hypothetical protein
VRVELLDADGKRVRGFNYDDALPFKGDTLRHSVRWKSGGLSGLPEQQCILRIHIKNATAYALTITSRP